MDWSQLLASLLGALVGGGLVIVADYFRTTRELAAKRSDVLVDQYADLLVHFHASLHIHSRIWGEIAWADNHGQNAEVRPEDWAQRGAAEQGFRDALWRVQLREPNADQQRRLENLVSCFHWDDEDGESQDEFAHKFPARARSLNEQMNTVTDFVRRRHADSLVEERAASRRAP